MSLHTKNLLGAAQKNTPIRLSGTKFLLGFGGVFGAA
jgi:hypothetical protein